MEHFDRILKHHSQCSHCFFTSGIDTECKILEERAGRLMSESSISYLWREPKAAEGFASGVSLHSHTNQSRETLDFIAEMSQDWGILQPIMRWAEERSYERTGIRPNYAVSYWTPPLTPKLAFDLEQKQIENCLQLPG